MELTLLYYFKTVAELENITKAAETLYISQPALSKAIAKLEKEMREAAKMLEFELAAALRDQIIELRGK